MLGQPPPWQSIYLPSKGMRPVYTKVSFHWAAAFTPALRCAPDFGLEKPLLKGNVLLTDLTACKEIISNHMHRLRCSYCCSNAGLKITGEFLQFVRHLASKNPLHHTRAHACTRVHIACTMIAGRAPLLQQQARRCAPAQRCGLAGSVRRVVPFRRNLRPLSAVTDSDLGTAAGGEDFYSLLGGSTNFSEFNQHQAVHGSKDVV
eukprot:1162152-Pelagomonas_calceolata.AAC.5